MSWKCTGGVLWAQGLAVEHWLLFLETALHWNPGRVESVQAKADSPLGASCLLQAAHTDTHFGRHWDLGSFSFQCQVGQVNCTLSTKMSLTHVDDIHIHIHIHVHTHKISLIGKCVYSVVNSDDFLSYQLGVYGFVFTKYSCQ